MLILFSAFLVILFLFKNFKLKKNILILDKKIIFFYSIILIIFIIWLTKHPTLRYGGYPIVFLTISIPIAIIYQNFVNKNFFEKKLKFLILLIVVIFNLKNINRINNEFQRNDIYKFNNFPFFAIEERKYFTETTPSGLIVYKTKGYCWNTPSPCTRNLEEFSFEIKKKYGFYFINR